MLWWDLALDALALADASLAGGGSISAFERDSVYEDTDGNRLIISPADEEAAGTAVGFYSANQTYRLG
jgi:hypothetical protein